MDDDQCIEHIKSYAYNRYTPENILIDVVDQNNNNKKINKYINLIDKINLPISEDTNI
jgi:hypothetical protein